jgi:hypothetical protein
MIIVVVETNIPYPASGTRLNIKYTVKKELIEEEKKKAL